MTFKTEKKTEYFIRALLVGYTCFKKAERIADSSCKCIIKVIFSVVIIIYKKIFEIIDPD